VADSVDLDLGALSGAPIKIRDRAGRIWLADSAMPMYTMFTLYELAQKAAREGTTENFGMDEVQRVTTGLHAIFSAVTPEVSEDDVRRAFTLEQMLQVIAFLSSRGAVSQPTLDPATATAGPTTTTTRTRRKSSAS
jgi:hypothetical protein